MIRAAEHNAVPLLHVEMCDLIDWRALHCAVGWSLLEPSPTPFCHILAGKVYLASFLGGKESESSTPCQVK